MNTITLRQLVAAGAVKHAVFRAVPGGFVLTVPVGIDDQMLEAQRGGARRFRSLDAGARFAHSVGLSSFEVDLSKFATGRALI